MELKYIILTIIKILISVPAIVLVAPLFAEGAALMGGHLDNKSNSSSAFLNLTSSYFDFDLGNDQELSASDSGKEEKSNSRNNSQTLEEVNQEEIPDPSALVVPGYNLPENIFNKGKPFYLEKDPLTGAVDFENRSPNLKGYDDEYDYADEEDLGGSDLYAKANIDRKDGGLSSHKNSDVNQLTPNLYDFLNLPLKYNSDKYVYPLISSSYANTKVQGNVNKHHNHKDYSVTTYKPVKTPTYFPTKSAYFNKETKTTERMVTATTRTTTSTTPRTTAQVYLTTEEEVNLMDTAMNHPSFTPHHNLQTQKSKVEDIYLTTTEKAASSSSSSSTERIMSLFEQFIAGFDEPITTTTTTTTEKSKPIIPPPTPSVEGVVYNFNGHASPQLNILAGTNMGHPSAYDYDYEEDVTDNIAVENKPPAKIHVVMMATQNASAPEGQAQVKNKKDEFNLNSTLSLNLGGNPEQEGGEEASYEDDYLELTTPKLSTESSSTPKVTSLPLGENHVSYSNPIIVATQNLREQLNNEKVVPKPFGFDKQPLLHPLSGTSNIHIAPDQDTVSFVVGNHQNVDGQYIATALKESPYDTNPFRPLYSQAEEQQNANSNQNVVSYTLQTSPEVYKPAAPPNPNPQNYDLVKIQPMRNSEASLAIGVPLNLVKGKPGQVVDGSSEINNEKIEFPKGNGPKIVFPDEKTTYVPPPSKNFLHPPPNKQFMAQPNREVLKLNSQPMFHQLPSDLTPPNEPNTHPTMNNRERPPWDPRPGHFHSGRPEYARPPRPPNQNGDAFKRIDTLPNILPQFRPNVKHIHKGYLRQPLLDRPSNRPIGFFEKLHPPPPPPKLQLMKEQEQNYRQNMPAEERIVTDGYKKTDQFVFYQTPPKMVLATRRNGDDDVEVETLQMLQAKQQDKKEKPSKIEMTSSFQANLNGKDSIEKPLYVVYPVNTPPLKLDAIDTNKKEAVVIGTRAELPLPPSKIQPEEEAIGSFETPTSPFLVANQDVPKIIPKNDYKLPQGDFDFQQNDRHDSPVLKPHHRNPNFPIKSEFPYPLERPLSSLLNSAPVETTSNDLDNQKFSSSNQWNSLDETESRIVTGSKINTQNNNQISVKLKTYTEKPIAVAYTPTESQKPDFNDRYSMPNYAGPVIPEIRLEGVVAPSNSAAFVLPSGPKLQQEKIENVNGETTHVPQLDFQAPFQASLNVGNVSHGWSVIKDKAKEDDGKDETTTPAVSSTSEFDIENFKPQLIGGFKPIYNFPDDEGRKEMEVKERQE